MAETWAENNPYAQPSESMEQLQKDEHVCHHVFPMMCKTYLG